MHFVWQEQDAANLMVSDFAKASRNLQLLDLRDAFCVADAGRGEPYDHFWWQALYESTNRKVGNDIIMFYAFPTLRFAFFFVFFQPK